ncbi:DUF883 family protein [Dyella ginsengisoli]|uniref:DUF883 family protein n=1 Tax=Dyella ginsengisoli TaxID=363848 RepID=A0ABW8JV92_9GAMM
MSHLHTDRLRNDLGQISSDIERLLRDAADDAGGLAQETKDKLQAVREQLMELERDTAERAGKRLARARERVREQPWLLIGTIAAGAFLLGLLGRGRID